MGSILQGLANKAEGLLKGLFNSFLDNLSEEMHNMRVDNKKILADGSLVLKILLPKANEDDNSEEQKFILVNVIPELEGIFEEAESENESAEDENESAEDETEGEQSGESEVESVFNLIKDKGYDSVKYVKLRFKYNDKMYPDVTHVPVDKIGDAITQFVDTNFESSYDEIQLNSSIQIGISKTITSSETIISLSKVMCSYDPEVSDIIEDTLNNFDIDELPEGESFFELEPEDAIINIEQITDISDTCAVCTSIEEMFNKVYNTYAIMHYCSLMQPNEDCRKLMQEYKWSVDDMVIELSKLCLENNCNIVLDMSDVDIDTPMSYDNAEELKEDWLKLTFSDIADMMDLYYPNFTHDIQTQILDKNIRFLRNVIALA